MKPVAYITKYDLERLPLYDCWVNGEKSKGSVPLYTHPVKELTDEDWVAVYMTWCLTSNDPLVLKQAILERAQEK